MSKVGILLLRATRGGNGVKLAVGGTWRPWKGEEIIVESWMVWEGTLKFTSWTGIPSTRPGLLQAPPSSSGMEQPQLISHTHPYPGCSRGKEERKMQDRREELPPEMLSPLQEQEPGGGTTVPRIPELFRLEKLPEVTESVH